MFLFLPSSRLAAFEGSHHSAAAQRQQPRSVLPRRLLRRLLEDVEERKKDVLRDVQARGQGLVDLLLVDLPVRARQRVLKVLPRYQTPSVGAVQARLRSRNRLPGGRGACRAHEASAGCQAPQQCCGQAEPEEAAPRRRHAPDQAQAHRNRLPTSGLESHATGQQRGHLSFPVLQACRIASLKPHRATLGIQAAAYRPLSRPIAKGEKAKTSSRVAEQKMPWTSQPRTQGGILAFTHPA